MNYTNFRVLILFSACLSSLSYAQPPQLADANRLFDFAQTAEPGLFFPAAETQQVSEAGSEWFVRFFSGSNSYAAVNINGTGPYFAGNVYVLGAQFGEGLLLVDSLQNLLASVDAAGTPEQDGTNAIIKPGNGNCVARRTVPQNDTAGYRTTVFSGDTQSVTEWTEFYELASDARTVTVIEQTTVIDGISTSTSTRQTLDFETIGGLYYQTQNDSVATTSAAGVSNTVQNFTTSYSPSLFIGPADSWCEGQEWFAAPVTQTTVDDLNSSNGPTVSQTPPTVATVDSVGETVTVRGGTYRTIRMTLTYPESRTVIWTDIEFGVRVLTQTFEGDSSDPSSVVELIQFELPF